jgi:hypothetical protein
MDINPLSQLEVEQSIAHYKRRLQEVTTEVASRARAAAAADADYKVAHAKAFLAAEGTKDERMSTASVECDDLYRARKHAEALLLSAQEAGRNARAALEGDRSLAANVRQAVEHPTGVGG